MIRAIGAVLGLRYHHLFQIAPLAPAGALPGRVGRPLRRRLRRAGGLRPAGLAGRAGSPRRSRPCGPPRSRPTRTAGSPPAPSCSATTPTGRPRPTPADALPYGVELTSLKSIHRLCDGKRTLFLVDRDGRLAEIIDVERWAAPTPGDGRAEVPCAAVVRRARAGDPRAAGTSAWC